MSGFISLNTSNQRQSATPLQLVASALFGLRLEWLLDIPGSRRLMGEIMKARVRSLRKSAKPDQGFYAGAGGLAEHDGFHLVRESACESISRGREPQGFVDPADYEAVRDKVRTQFAGLKDPENGMNVFRYAQARERVLSARTRSSLPT